MMLVAALRSGERRELERLSSGRDTVTISPSLQCTTTLSSLSAITAKAEDSRSMCVMAECADATDAKSIYYIEQGTGNSNRPTESTTTHLYRSFAALARSLRDKSRKN